MKRIFPALRALICVMSAAAFIAALVPAEAEAWTAKPSFSITAALSADGKSVEATVSSSASDPVSSLQFEIAYDSSKLAAVSNPRLLSPWSGMLSSTNVPEAGRAAAAAATASAGINNSGGAVSSMTFGIASGASGSAVIALRNVVVCDSSGTAVEISAPASVTIDLTTGAVTDGGVLPAAETPDSSGNTAESADTAKRLSDVIVLKIGSGSALRSGEVSAIDPTNGGVVPYINSDSRTMVPLRFVAEALGADVTWIPDGKKIEMVRGGKTITMAIGSPDYTVDGKGFTMDTAPVILGSRTYVPVRAAAEAFGADVEWEASNRLVIISPADDPWKSDGSAEAAAAAHAAELIAPPAAVGDADGSGKITADDAVAVLRHIVGSVTLTAAQRHGADANGDSAVSADDAVRILRYIVGGTALG